MIGGNLADTLGIVSDPHLPAQLLSGQHNEAVRRVAATLPARLTECLLYECRLQESAPAADLSLCVRGDQGVELLSGAEEWLPQGHVNAPGWQRLLRFCEFWQSSDRIDEVWLEFDVVGSGGVVPEPMAFFLPKNNSLCRGADVTWVMKGLETLSGAPISAASQKMVERCVRALPKPGYFGGVPSGCQVYAIATMQGRAASPIRLVISNMKRHNLLLYLREIGWPGNREILRQLLEWLPGPSAINIDITDRVGPRLGLDCHACGSFGAGCDRNFIMQLVERGYCLAEKREGVVDFHGWASSEGQVEEWPTHLAEQLASGDIEKASLFCRYLNHIKVDIGSDQEIQAKAYMAVTHEWVASEELDHKLALRGLKEPVQPA